MYVYATEEANVLFFGYFSFGSEFSFFFVFSSKGHKMKQISVQNDNNIRRTKMYVVEPNRNNDDDVSIEKSKISERWQKITTLLRIWYIIFFLRHILRADVAGKLRSLFGFLTASVYSFVWSFFLSFVLSFIFKLFYGHREMNAQSCFIWTFLTGLWCSFCHDHRYSIPWISTYTDTHT